MIIPMRALTKGIMLGLLLIPLAAAINMDNAFAESFTVDLCVGGASQDNKCFYVPEKIMINVGDTVIWTNSDSATHTVTSGDLNDPNTWGLIIESGLLKPDSTFEYTFDTEADYPYFCQLHPWMIGKVMVKEGTILRGTNFDLNINPALPFDRTANNMVVLSFNAKAEEFKGDSITPGLIDHLDYKVTMMNNDAEVWSEQFHDHDGYLELQITTSSSVEVTGGEGHSSKSSTGPYRISGPIFDKNGSYTVIARVVGIEFESLPSPMEDNFSIKVVPEFSVTVMVVMGMIVAMGIVATRLSRVSKHVYEPTT